MSSRDQATTGTQWTDCLAAIGTRAPSEKKRCGFSDMHHLGLDPASDRCQDSGPPLDHLVASSILNLIFLGRGWTGTMDN